MFVFSNLATSIDGKIATSSRGHFPLGTPADRRLMRKLRTRADAIIIGAETLRAYRRPMLALDSVKQAKQPLNVVVSSKLEGISARWSFFTDPRTRKVIFVSSDASEARVRMFARAMGKSGEIFRLKRSVKPRGSQSIAPELIRRLGPLGVRRLLIEGGGGLMWDFIRPNLIDELYLTLTPRIVGGALAPTLVDGVGFSSAQVLSFKLRSCRRLGDELYLVYSRGRRRTQRE